MTSENIAIPSRRDTGYIHSYRKIKQICVRNKCFDFQIMRSVLGVPSKLLNKMQFKHGDDHESMNSDIFDIWYPVAKRFCLEVTPGQLLAFASLIAFQRDIFQQLKDELRLSFHLINYNEDKFWNVIQIIRTHLRQRIKKA